jgi:hypothetical protein
MVFYECLVATKNTASELLHIHAVVDAKDGFVRVLALFGTLTTR